MIPLTNHDSSEGEQWGRYNLPSHHDTQAQLAKCLREGFRDVPALFPGSKLLGTPVTCFKEGGPPKETFPR